MDLRDRLNAVPETLQNVELAALEKRDEGGVCLRAGEYGAAIYLLGYAAEMTLKVAAFKVDGLRATHLVGASLASLRRNWASRHLPSVREESFHSLLFWIQVLRIKRRQNGLTTSRAVDRRAAGCVARVYQTWWVDMRYRPDQSLPSEAYLVYNDTNWLLDHRVQLWSY